jgi:hypothetical protein
MIFVHKVAIATAPSMDMRGETMLHRSSLHHPVALPDGLRDARVATTALLQEFTGQVCSSPGQRTKSARIKRLIQAGAWIDAALALIDLELPSWRVRRIAYDGGEWHCALSREPELPDWLDQSVEARHADPALAVLSALLEAQSFLEAQSLAKRSSRPSVPALPCGAGSPTMTMCCDNFF